MSLNWNIVACDPSVKTEGNWPFTENLIFATMAVDMGQITEANIEEFATRIGMYGQVYGPLFQRVTDGKIVGRTIAVNDLRPYIGLRTNVSTTTAAMFKNRLAREIRDRAKRAATA